MSSSLAYTWFVNFVSKVSLTNDYLANPSSSEKCIFQFYNSACDVSEIHLIHLDLKCNKNMYHVDRFCLFLTKKKFGFDLSCLGSLSSPSCLLPLLPLKFSSLPTHVGYISALMLCYNHLFVYLSSLWTVSKLRKDRLHPTHPSIVSNCLGAWHVIGP